MNLNFTKLKDELLFVPLGGSDEIGMNFYLYHIEGKWLIVDLGMGFADENLPGVDLIVPDITFLEQIRHNIVGLVLTHAHEDHIGAVPYLWSQIQAPIYTTKFTCAVVKAKLTESGLASKVPFHEVKANSRFSVGPFNLEFIELTHSVPEMQGLVIRTEKGNIFHTGDWKFDPNPVVGDGSDQEKLAALGREGILAMVGDSTNILTEGHSGSEGALVESLTNLISAQKDNLVVVSSFASNIARIQTIAKAAQRCGRKVALAGTSLWRMTDAARQCGYLADIADFIKPRDIVNYKREEVLVIATGCQGEEFAAVNKLANGTHQDFKLIRGDLVIFSSRIIPGNETRIFEIFNKMCKNKIDVITEKDHFVHVSGHPCRDEVKKMYELIKPKVAIPVHGAPIHIHEHCAFAELQGVDLAIQVEDGAVVALSHEKSGIIGKVQAGMMAIDGNFIIPSDSEIIRFRKKMRDNGILFVNVILSKSGKLLKTPIINAPGVLDSKEDGEYFDMIIESIIEIVSNNNRKSEGDLENKIRTSVKRFIRAEIAKEPYVQVNIHKLNV